jgi:hypothetical protein
MAEEKKKKEPPSYEEATSTNPMEFWGCVHSFVIGSEDTANWHGLPAATSAIHSMELLEQHMLFSMYPVLNFNKEQKTRSVLLCPPLQGEGQGRGGQICQRQWICRKENRGVWRPFPDGIRPRPRYLVLRQAQGAEMGHSDLIERDTGVCVQMVCTACTVFDSKLLNPTSNLRFG